MRRINLKTYELIHESKLYPNGYEGSFAYFPPLAEVHKNLIDIWNLSVEVFATACGWKWRIARACKYVTGGSLLLASNYGGPNGNGAWDDYEDALEAGIQCALTVYKDEK